jgi:hypothetical protein
MIEPTIGRVVWYSPAEAERIKGEPTGQLCAAIITYVWDDRMVNLMATTPNGTSYGVTSVTLVQEGDPNPIERFCMWMPYQIGQAKKHA